MADIIALQQRISTLESRITDLTARFEMHTHPVPAVECGVQRHNQGGGCWFVQSVTTQAVTTKTPNV